MLLIGLNHNKNSENRRIILQFTNLHMKYSLFSWYFLQNFMLNIKYFKIIHKMMPMDVISID